jgi:DNA-binding response OmpR family regulator
VLVVDDDPTANRLVISALQQARLEARSTEDPSLAWQWLQQEHYDVFLLDIEMPGMDGFEFCKRLRALPAYAKKPVIFITGHADFQHRAKVTLSGGDELVSKPILPMEVAAKVVMHLVRKKTAA